MLKYSNNLIDKAIPSSKRAAMTESSWRETFYIFNIPFDWGDDVMMPRRQIYMRSNSTTFDDQGFAKDMQDYREPPAGSIERNESQLSCQHQEMKRAGALNLECAVAIIAAE